MLRYGVRKILVPSSSGHVSVRAIVTSSSLSLEKCVNEVKLLGRVGRDPVRTEEAVFFSLATNYRRVTGNHAPDGTKVIDSKVTWHNIVAFRPPNKDYIMRNITKGCRVLVDGHLTYSRSKDENDEMITRCSIISNSVIIMDNPQFRKAKALDYEETASTDDDPSLNNEEPAVNRDTHS